ncbi:Eukaryotic translation initiation factor 5A-1 [Stylosanthes scabra]|uniref:Eukaryotic translation initiation factor 5A-1 n=1 Tax=Stylosanthes scabra TaxID=79078 RepID=A0ABU6VBL8_9FABA|nr:Eukaryotic translation initiation factor 5A-1 [Stylosanthes scabra]
MRDKLTTFILKNPPETKKGSKDKKAVRRAEKERLKEGEMADEEQKKIKEVKKKVSSTSKDGIIKSTTKKKASTSDDDRISPTHSQVEEKEDASQEEEEDDDIQWQTDASLEAARQRIQEQLSAVTDDMVMLSTNEPEKNGKITSKESNGSENGGSHDYSTLVGEVKAILNKGVAKENS